MDVGFFFKFEFLLPLFNFVKAKQELRVEGWYSKHIIIVRNNYSFYARVISLNG